MRFIIRGDMSAHAVSCKMKPYIFIISLFAGLYSTACSTTGVDKKLQTPVAGSDSTLTLQKDTAEAAGQDTLVIAITGDIMMGTTYPARALPADNGRMLFKDVKDILSRADIAAGNLEGTLCDSAETTKKKSAHTYAFRTPVAFAPRLKEAGYDFLSMANNHAFDFGTTGIKSTEKALDDLGIKYAGIKGRTTAAVIERNGIRYGLCAFGHNSYTLRHQELPAVKEILDSLTANTDIVIVSFHGGAEGRTKSHLPYGKEMFLEEDRGSLREFARFCVDNGADIVFGHGPHVVRCVEVYKDRFIAYSLGNFCTPYGISLTGISGYAPVIETKINRNGEFLSGQIHSFIQRRGAGPRKDSTNIVAKQIKSLTATDVPGSRITISNNGKISLK